MLMVLTECHLKPQPTALERLVGFSFEHCLMKVWPNTDLFCGGSHGIPVEERLRVKRPYGRVDRVVRFVAMPCYAALRSIDQSQSIN